jgi:peptidoglycan/xylan/chitin deacetylase (PgdA/CDA1 family)
MRALTKVKTDERVIALTFDDGPGPDTDILLDILKDHNAKATFFVVGTRGTPAGQTTLARMQAEGHAIGNHSLTHLPTVGFLRTRWELREAEKSIGSHFISQPKMYRPPWGFQNIRTWLATRWMGYIPTMWTYDILDWKFHHVDCLDLYFRTKITPGSIVLMHDNHKTDRMALFKALDRSLSQLPRYRFVTVPELLKIGDPIYDIWYKVPRE